MVVHLATRRMVCLPHSSKYTRICFVCLWLALISASDPKASCHHGNEAHQKIIGHVMISHDQRNNTCPSPLFSLLPNGFFRCNSSVTTFSLETSTVVASITGFHTLLDLDRPAGDPTVQQKFSFDMMANRRRTVCLSNQS